VPIPEAIAQELKVQIEKVARLHEQDLVTGYDGVFLDDEIEKKYPKALKEFMYQWVFPQQSLTVVEESDQRRRYHLHESRLQGALYYAVRKAKIPEKVIATPSAALLQRTFCKPTTISELFRRCRAFQPEKYDDVYPLCPGENHQGSKKPAGFMSYTLISSQHHTGYLHDSS
jgi:hypothetical protein